MANISYTTRETSRETHAASSETPPNKEFVIKFRPTIVDDNGTAPYVWDLDLVVPSIEPVQYERDMKLSKSVASEVNMLVGSMILPITEALEELIIETGFEITESLCSQDRARYSQCFREVWQQVPSKAREQFPGVDFSVELDLQELEGRPDVVTTSSSEPTEDALSHLQSKARLNDLWDQATERGRTSTSSIIRGSGDLEASL
ncbi:hypothetical protein EHS25_008277 [Saitozyma podzolica]|uniref:Uncharacterized protein n=1 Tax=Saitozyma podzolica TaxID=1890683 RepID=A0A427YP29_9TREE|nr:hypothetical protein EHS25_008277 [Saitozyma podzolica]